MPRIETTKRTLYKFSELSKEAQTKAIEQKSRDEAEFFSYGGKDNVYEDFQRIAEILGITFKERTYRTMGGGTGTEPCIWYSGFSSQGDGASFEGTYEYKKGSAKEMREYAPLDTELHRIANELTAIQKKFFYKLTAEITTSGNYSHSGTMSVELDVPDNPYYKMLPWKEVEQLMRDLADWLYKTLEKEYWYQTGDEQCRERLEEDDDENEFTENGAKV